MTRGRRRVARGERDEAGEQAALIAERFQELQPSADALAGRIIETAGEARPFVAECGIDPTVALR